ncbi:unnamed protein product [Euphydryas editha]|uniref:Uncharacterized protein n=1 Tax=Euphydryas editha TaxID=104508 RepID=A0AAU9UA37_EUPED|nr:unnamed protein product [Euphydryas editha]
MCLVILQKAMSYSLSLSKQLQAINTDIITAFSHLDVINALQLLRHKVDEKYLYLYEEAKVLLEVNGGILLMPRIVGRQLNQSNILASDISTYYKINLFLRFLDHTIQQLIERFTKHRKVISALSGTAGCEIEEAFRMYSVVLPEKSISVVKAKLEV